jgi:predicted dehydrogenase
MSKIKLAVIGVGHLGSKHTKVYNQLKNKVNLVGVCDCVGDKARVVAAQYRTRPYLNYRDLLEKVDAVSICVPTKLHYKIAKDFLLYGVNVLIEKPITFYLRDADILIELAKKNGLILQVGHVERFNSAFRAIKKIVKNPRFIECHRLSPFPGRSLDVGVVLDLMIHDIDIILGLINSQVKNIQAVGVNVLTAFEDISNARITFKNGCVCNLTASRVSDEPMRKIRIFFKNTYISLDYVNQQAFLYQKHTQRITKQSLPIEKEEPLKKEIESFIDCVKNKKRPVVSGLEAREALGLAIKIKKRIWKSRKR